MPHDHTRKRAMNAAERKAASRARQAERQAARRLLFEAPDWRELADPAALPRRAGCSAADLPAIVLREIADNAADEGGATLTHEPGAWWRIADTGPGLAPEDVPRIFDLRRASLSSKRVRRPQRGQLGNGIRAVCGFAAIHALALRVTSRGVRHTLAIDRHTGRTTTAATEAVEAQPGTVIEIEARGPLADDAAGRLARLTLAVRQNDDAREYRGPSLPGWYDAEDFAGLLGTAPAGSTVADVIRSLGLAVPPALRDAAKMPAGDATAQDAAAVLAALAERFPPIPPERIGRLGRDAFGDALPAAAGYARIAATWRDGGAVLPVMVEAWATCERKRDRGPASLRRVHVYANQSASLTALYAEAAEDGARLSGGGLYRHRVEARPGDYGVAVLSIVSPFLPTSDAGKALDLDAMRRPVAEAIGKALAAARRNAPTDPEEGKRLAAAREAAEDARQAGRMVEEIAREQARDAREVKRRQREADEATKAQRRRAEEAQRAAWHSEARAIPLHAIVTEAAKAAGTKPDAFAVLSPKRDPFTMHNATKHRAGQWLADHLARLFPDPEAQPHPRAAHYAISSTGATRPDGTPYLNNSTCYRWLKDTAVKGARWGGFIAWERIGDARTRAPRIFVAGARASSPFQPVATLGAAVPAFAFDPPAILADDLAEAADVLPAAALDGGPAQPWRIALWAEKASAAPLLERLAEEIQGEAIAATGDAADGAIFAMLQRAAADPRRALAILTVCDFDPDGHRMPIGIARKAQAMIAQRGDLAGLRVEVVRVGLTREQCEAWELLDAPLKQSHAARARWIAHMGRQQTELDAALIVAPDRLEAAMREAIAAYHDPDLGARAREARAGWRREAEAWRDALPWWPRAARIVAARRDSAQAAADGFRERVAALVPEAQRVEAERARLRRMQERAADRLALVLPAAIEAGEVPPPPDPPAPDLTAGPPRIFDSVEGFAEATRRMQAHRLPDGLRGDDAEGEEGEAEGEA